MINRVLIIFSVSVVLLLLAFTLPLKNKRAAKNNVPVVKIVAPKNNSRFGPNTRLTYSITVSDKEDGESKYDEINTTEVLLQVKYISNQSAIQKELSQGVQNDSKGLEAIRTSNCFNCHTFTTKAIGPSFYDIYKKYPASGTNMALLVKHIREGSTGVWGKVSMPTHPELTAQETQNMVQWILHNAAERDNNYYTGTEGAFLLQPGSLTHKDAAYLLTASYTDHGVKDDSVHRLKGQDRVVIYCR